MAISKPEAVRAADLFPSRHCFDVAAYNFEHFRFKHFWFDAKQTVQKGGIQPGEFAPDFQLPRVGGGSVRLSDLRGKPVLLHFGSFT